MTAEQIVQGMKKYLGRIATAINHGDFNNCIKMTEKIDDMNVGLRLECRRLAGESGQLVPNGEGEDDDTSGNDYDE